MRFVNMDSTSEKPIITAIEANQSIQTKSHTVRLFENKACMVRVFVSLPSAIQNRYVRGTLRLNQADMGQAYTFKSTPRFITETIPVDIDVWRRRGLMDSLNFLVPKNVLKPGEADFQFIALSSIDNKSEFTWSSDAPCLQVKVHPATELQLRLLGINLTPDQTTNQQSNFKQRFSNTESYLERMFPVSSVKSTNSIVGKPPTTAPLPGEPELAIEQSNTSTIETFTTNATDVSSEHLWKKQINAIHMQLLIMRHLDIESGIDWRTHYHSILFSPREPFHGRASDVPANPDVAVVSAGPSVGLGIDHSGANTAHELGHVLGLLHPGYCHNQEIEDFDAHEQYPRGVIATAMEDTVGIDTGDTNIGAQPVLLDGRFAHDVMTYCTNVWISKRNYDHIHFRLMQEEHLIRPYCGRFIAIVGQYDTVAKSGAFGGIHRLTNAVLSSHVETSCMSIQLTTISQTKIVHCIPDKNPLAIGGDFTSGVFSMVVEEPEPLESIELLLDNSPIAVLHVNSCSNDESEEAALNAACIYVASLTEHLHGKVINFTQSQVPENVFFAIQVKSDQTENWLTIGVFVNCLENTLIDEQYITQSNCRIRVVLSSMNHSRTALDQLLESPSGESET